jgi:Kef-type K+ transport system membrane component KefB
MFTNLLIVAAAGLLAPLVLGFFPRIRLPAIVLEILLGILIGPSGLGWTKPDAPVSIVALVGLAFLLFLSGLEIDVDRLRGQIVTLTALGFAVSFVIAILIGLALRAGGLVKSALFVAIVLVATSLGVVFPVLKDSHTIDSSLGQLVIAAASIAEFGSIILLSLFFSGKSSTSTAGRLILLGLFGLVVVLVGAGIARLGRRQLPPRPHLPRGTHPRQRPARLRLVPGRPPRQCLPCLLPPGHHHLRRPHHHHHQLQHQRHDALRTTPNPPRNRLTAMHSLSPNKTGWCCRS